MSSLIGACNAETEPPIQVILGPSEADQTRFTPKASFAEYVELPGGGSELRLTLASYAASCERFIPPADQQLLVVVVVVTPAAAKLGSGPYSWTGHAAHGGTATTPTKPYAAPSVRWGNRSYRIQPGGTIQLASLNLIPQGNIKGTLAFEFAGDAQEPASRIAGGFDAELCRLERSKP